MRILLILLLCLPAVSRGESNPSWGLQQLMSSLAQVKESRAKFSERKYLSVLKQPLESSGTLLFLAPDHLEKHTLTPRQESMVLHQDNLSIEIKARNIKRTLMLQEYPAIWALVESIRSTLAGNLSTLERFFKLELEGDESRWHLKLLPAEARSREVVSEIRISGHGSALDSIEIFEANGDHSLMKVEEVKP